MKTLLLLLTLTLALFSQEWSREKDKDAVTIYSRPFDGTKFLETKGTAVIEASLEEVVLIIEDVSKRTTWWDVYKLAENISHQSKSLIRTVTSMPFPLKDREAIWERTAITYDKEEGLYRNVFHAVDLESYPHSGRDIRIVNGRGEWTACALSATTTQVTYPFGSDPAGGIPHSFVNVAAKSIPVKTLNALRKAVNDGYYQQRLTQR